MPQGANNPAAAEPLSAGQSVPSLHALPWLILVDPARSWRVLRKRTPWIPATLACWYLLSAGWILAAKPLSETMHAAGLSRSAGEPSPGGIVLGVLTLLLLTACSTLSLGLLVHAALLLTRSAGRFAESLTLGAYAFMPAFLGRLLGLIIFAMLQLLSNNPAEAVSIQIAPAVFGFGSLFPALSFAWVAGCFFDLFGVWSLILTALGLRQYIGLDARKTAWTMASLVLIWLLVLTLFWQGITRGLP